MSIATEITRLQNAKASIKTSIENKGVTVPSATKLDGYSTLIDSIQTGGGGISIDDLAQNLQPSGALVFGSDVTTISDYAFAYRTGITSVTGQNVTNIKQYAFEKCTGLTSIDFPNVTKIDQYCFERCSGLTQVDLPKLEEFSSSHNFRYCTGLVSARMPVYNKDGRQNFTGCTNLELVDYGKALKMSSNCFQNDAKLKTLILRKTTICSLDNINCFSGTPFASGGSGGTIYIPKSLYDHLGDGSSSDYQQATNWSTIYGYGTITWAKIEGSIYE